MVSQSTKTITVMETRAEKFINWIGSITSIIIHTIIFAVVLLLVGFGVEVETVLLVLTTAVSLEAIYLAIFIQMTVNKHTQSLAVVEEDLEEIQEDVEGIEKDIDEIEKDIDEMQEDVDEMEKDLDKLEASGEREGLQEKKQEFLLAKIQTDLAKLVMDIEALNQKNKQ